MAARESRATGAAVIGDTPRLSAAAPALRRADAIAVDWQVADGLVPFDAALAAMEARAAAIAAGSASELVWLLQHPPLFTAGTSAGAIESTLRFPLHRTGRGGQVTYHGPGQRIVYVLLDLSKRREDVRAYVGALERWIIATLARFGIDGGRREARVGVWVVRPEKSPGSSGEPAEDKIAAIGIRVRRWVTFHGLSINLDPDLSHYGGITPCGIAESHLGVTSLADLGSGATLRDLDEALRSSFEPIFGPTRAASA